MNLRKIKFIKSGFSIYGNGPISYRFQDKRRFLLKIAPPHNNTPAKEVPVPLGKCYGSEFKTTGDWCLTLGDGIRSLTRCIRSDTVPQCDGRTDGVGETISRCAC